MNSRELKKGVLELADAVAVNKSDGKNIQRAETARKELANALQMLTPASPHLLFLTRG